MKEKLEQELTALKVQEQRFKEMNLTEDLVLVQNNIKDIEAELEENQANTTKTQENEDKE